MPEAGDVVRLKDATHSGEFEAARDEGRTVIADFFTKACVLCRKVEPMLAAAATGAGGTVSAFRIDAEENRKLAVEYEVRGVPTLLLFHRGELIDRKVGFVTAKELRAWVAPYLER